MSFLKYNSFSRKTKKTEQQRKNVNAYGWRFYSCLPYGEPWPMQHLQDWVMEKGDETAKLHYQGISCEGTALVWRNRSTGEIRIPQEKNFSVNYGFPFKVSGKLYMRVQDLVAARCKDDPSCCWALDCYGRKVFNLSERFDCFDSYDYLSEERHYHWIYLCEGGVLTRICTSDGWENQKIQVSTDVSVLENKAWEMMEQTGYLERR